MSSNWRKVVVKFGAFDAAATTDTVDLYKTKHHEFIEKVIMRCDTDFAGGSLASYTVSVGKSGSVTKYLGATNVFTGVSNGNGNGTVGTVSGEEAAGTQLFATATGSHNLSTATAGQVTFFIRVGNLPPGT